jgi:GMP synthase-like glutamine amidotransferase
VDRVETLPITREDEQLIAEVADVIARYYELTKHHNAAAVRTKTGQTYAAVHLEANVGRVAVCAETIAVGKAISEVQRRYLTTPPGLLTCYGHHGNQSFEGGASSERGYFGEGSHQDDPIHRSS